MTKNYLKFWGTRGTCPVSGSEYARFGGNTSSLEIRSNDSVILIDMGSGVHLLGRELIRQKVRHIDLFMSHAHWDHLIGFPYFEPLFEPGVQITIWAPPSPRRSYKELFTDLLAPEYFPVRLEEIKAHLEFKTIQQKTPVTIGDVTLDFHSTNHPGITYCFKIFALNKTIGYVTDNELFQNFHGTLDELTPQIVEPHQSLIEFLTGCDVIAHEAQYSPEEYLQKVGWGHSSTLNAAYLIEKTKTPHWLVTHHDPNHTDLDLLGLESDAQSLLKKLKIPSKVEWIPDGFVLTNK